MMFKFVVLVGFVACAVAVPTPEEVAPVRNARAGYLGCDCSNWKPSGSACLVFCALQRSMADVVPSEQMKMKRMVDFTRPELVGGAPVEVKQCFNKCVADYGASGDNFNYCIIGCNLGGQKLVEEEGVVPTGGRHTRGVESCYKNNCGWLHAFPDSFSDCMSACLASGGRRRSIDNPKDAMTSLIDVDFKPQLRDRKSDCVRTCFPGFTYFQCVMACNMLSGRSAEDGARSLKDDAFAVDGKREARTTRAQCELNCFIEGPFYYAACISDRCRGLHRSLGDNADPMLAGASSLLIDYLPH